MTLLRAAARTMLASYFVVNGANAVRQPDTAAAQAEPIATKVVPLTRRLAPAAIADYLPEDSRSWARILGVAQIVGGGMLATGIGRRCGAGILASTMVPQVIVDNPLAAPHDERPQVRARLIHNVALTGGVLLAALDTEGKPGLAWRIDGQKKNAAAGIDKAGKKASVAAKRASKRAVCAGRKARRQARKANRLVQEKLR